MAESILEADYLVKGAGAAGMAFVDSLLTDSEATVVMVDRHHRPGGHWNDAYPFVRLHQPSASYGVNSLALGSGAKDEVGLNKGLYELASGQEVLTHFDRVMQQRFLPSGRVRFFPMSELDEEGKITSLLSGEPHRAVAPTVVDATHAQTAVPSTTPPAFEIAPGVAFAPVNDLPRLAPDHEAFVLVGAGKTSMDACLWLLQNGTDPDRIRWIMPRDSWLLNRANLQPGEEFFGRLCKSLADQVEAIADAESVDDVFARLETVDEFRRIDPAVTPEAYHCAVVSDDEMAQLRRVNDVVRMGRVTEITPDQMVLRDGIVPTPTNALHVDCTAAGIPSNESIPVFDGDRITLQWVRICQPTFSAALIGHVEATYEDQDDKNRICVPVRPPTVPRDWLVMMEVELANRQRFSDYPELEEWRAQSRLDPFTALARERMGVDPEVAQNLERYIRFIGPAVAKIPELLAA